MLGGQDPPLGGVDTGGGEVNAIFGPGHCYLPLTALG